MKALTLFALLQGAQDEGLTIAEMIADIPHDVPAIVVYVLLGFSVGLVIWSGRRSSPRKPEPRV